MRALACGFVLVAACADRSLPAERLLAPAAPASAGGDAVVVTDDGAWCWFQDERAVYAGERLFVATLAHAGDVQVTAWDAARALPRHDVLRTRFERDDHDVASLLALADGRLLTVYSKHDGSRALYLRTTTDAGLGAWGAERRLDFADDVTYSNLFQLADEGGRVYLFFRGLAYNPTFVVSDDGGETWSAPGQVLESVLTTAGLRTEHRPYVKYVSDGRGAIHLFYTEGHPAEFGDNSVYHLVYRDGALRRSDGTWVAELAPGAQPRLEPAAGTRVYDGRREAGGQAWTWDAALDADGDPVVVFATFPDRAREREDHRYRYARWDGGAWRHHAVAHAGRALYAEQRFYSGGIALDPDDPDVVYLSSSVDPATGAATTGARFELYRGVTGDAGATWAFTALTAGSRVDNLRPIVPAHHPDEVAVLWMQGVYTSYLDWNTRVVGLFGDAGVDAIAPVDAPVLTPVPGAETVVAGGVVHVIGLEPGEEYVLRLGGDGEAPVWWFAADAAGAADAAAGAAGDPDNGALLGAQRRHALELRVTADGSGAVRLVGPDPSAGAPTVEAFRRPPSTSVARFDVTAAPGAGPAPGWTALGFDDAATWGGAAVAGGLRLTVWSDRLDSLRARDTGAPGDVAADFVFGDDQLVVDLAGLVPGRVYEITVHAADLEDHLHDAALWWLEAPGRQPVVLRDLQINDGTAGSAASFSFYHRASGPTLRLRAWDVLYELSSWRSIVMLGALDVRVVDEAARAAGLPGREAR